MKKSIIVIVIAIVSSILLFSFADHQSGHRTRPYVDYAYEHYCDSIWENDPDYYLDVLVETDEYQDYIDACGEWWDN